MTIQEEINIIIHEEYSDYKGRRLTDIFHQHATYRAEYGDEMFLIYLKKLKYENPRPIYKPPLFVREMIDKLNDNN